MVVPKIAAAAISAAPKVKKLIPSSNKMKFSQFKKTFEDLSEKEIISDFLEKNTEKVGNSTPVSENFDFKIPEPVKDEIEGSKKKEKEKGIVKPLDLKNTIPKISLPKAGSISLLLFIIIFILFSISKVKGTDKTRLQMIYSTIMGQTSLDNSEVETGEGIGSSIGNKFFDKLVDAGGNTLIPNYGEIETVVGIYDDIYNFIN